MFLNVTIRYGFKHLHLQTPKENSETCEALTQHLMKWTANLKFQETTPAHHCAQWWARGGLHGCILEVPHEEKNKRQWRMAWRTSIRDVDGHDGRPVGRPPRRSSHQFSDQKLIWTEWRNDLSIHPLLGYQGPRTWNGPGKPRKTKQQGPGGKRLAWILFLAAGHFSLKLSTWATIIVRTVSSFQTLLKRFLPRLTPIVRCVGKCVSHIFSLHSCPSHPAQTQTQTSQIKIRRDPTAWLLWMVHV